MPDELEGQSEGMLGDWVAVVCMVSVSPEGVPMAEYYLSMKDGAMLPHIIEGLLHKGIEQAALQTGDQT